MLKSTAIHTKVFFETKDASIKNPKSSSFFNMAFSKTVGQIYKAKKVSPLEHNLKLAKEAVAHVHSKLPHGSVNKKTDEQNSEYDKVRLLIRGVHSELADTPPEEFPNTLDTAIKWADKYIEYGEMAYEFISFIRQVAIIWHIGVTYYNAEKIYPN